MSKLKFILYGLAVLNLVGFISYAILTTNKMTSVRKEVILNAKSLNELKIRYSIINHDTSLAIAQSNNSDTVFSFIFDHDLGHKTIAPWEFERQVDSFVLREVRLFDSPFTVKSYLRFPLGGTLSRSLRATKYDTIFLSREELDIIRKIIAKHTNK